MNTELNSKIADRIVLLLVNRTAWILLTECCLCLLMQPLAALYGQQKPRPGEVTRPQGSGLGNYTQPPPACNVPEHPFDLILGRPTESSIELRIVQNEDGRGLVRYRPDHVQDWRESHTVDVTAGRPVSIVLTDLRPNSKYLYQWSFTSNATGHRSDSDSLYFHTARTIGSSFVFSVTADSHLDENSSGDVYSQTLRNTLADGPDFHLELGDTFMTGKYVRPELAMGHYLAQRYYLGQLCSSAPLFFVMGNHDGESGGRGSMTWASNTRKSLFPNPIPNQFYSGNQQREAEIGLPENYYAWRWGDAQFIVLDPYRYTHSSRRGDGKTRRTPNSTQGPANDSLQNKAQGSHDSSNWYWTLGDAQYRWLQAELVKPAKYRFVFIHHLVGGAVQNQRGGVEVASLWEWGGNDEMGEYQFDHYRKGWDKPIHRMLVESGVSIVFHGHDHFFAKQELDGIIYQEVPQPSHARNGNTRNATEYGYLMGDLQPSSGFVRVSVKPDDVRVDYVRTFAGSEHANRNREIAFSYKVLPQGAGK